MTVQASRPNSAQRPSSALLLQMMPRRGPAAIKLKSAAPLLTDGPRLYESRGEEKEL